MKAKYAFKGIFGMKRRRGDFRYTLSVRKMRKSRMRLFRLRVAKNKRAYFYRTRWWELHFRPDERAKRIAKRERTENERLERKCERNGECIAYVKRSSWSFHSGDRGFKAWLTDNAGRHIADVPTEIAWVDCDDEIRLFAATLGYDEVIDTHACAMIIE